jgi:hypothetical protein
MDHDATRSYNGEVMKEPLDCQRSDIPERETRQDTSDSGVDRTLIRWMMTLSPTERLEFVQRQVNAVQQMTEPRDSE